MKIQATNQVATLQPPSVALPGRPSLVPAAPPMLSISASIAALLLLFLAYRIGWDMPARYHVYNFHPHAAPDRCGGSVRRNVVRSAAKANSPVLRVCPASFMRTAWVIAGLASLISGVYLYATARRQGTEFILYFHDEHSFMLQLRALASGRLWLPPIPAPLRDFVESFNMLVYPKYGSIYFPGTALLYAPFIAVGLPWWFGPLVTMSLAIGFFYLLVTQMIDGVAGLLAILIMLACPQIRVESLMVLSQPAQILFEILLMLAYVAWRRDQAFRWAVAIGFFAGGAGTIRPADCALPGRSDRDRHAARSARP